MLLERKSPGTTPITAAPTGPNRARWLWLAAGAAGSLLAYHGRWDLPLAAWIFAIFLLRFTRTSRVLPGIGLVWLVYVLGGAFYLIESGLPVFTPLYGLFVGYGTILIAPYLLDRLIVPRLTAAGTLRSSLLATLVFPTAMVGAEYFLGAFSPLGIALSSVGTTQHGNLPLIQLAAITGTYGITFVLTWFATTVLHVWEHRLRWPEIRTATVVYAAVLTLVLIGGTVRIAFFAPDAPTVRVAAVSPAEAADARADGLLDQYDSIAQLAGADAAKVRPALDLVTADLLQSTEREARAGARIVVWPEAGALVLEQDQAALIQRIADVATRTGAYVEAGMLVITRQAPYYARNQAVLVDPQGRQLWTYDKTHPVPGMDQIAPGNGEVPATDSPYGRIATVICFDADFPDLLRENADLMLVPSNDWEEFGRTHTEKAALRAVENGYSLVRSDNHGVSGAFDPLGRSVGSADYFTTDQQTMVVSVPAKGIPTIYTAVGDLFSWLCVAGLIALILAGVRAGGSRRPVPGT